MPENSTSSGRPWAGMRNRPSLRRFFFPDLDNIPDHLADAFRQIKELRTENSRQAAALEEQRQTIADLISEVNTLRRTPQNTSETRPGVRLAKNFREFAAAAIAAGRRDLSAPEPIAIERKS